MSRHETKYQSIQNKEHRFALSAKLHNAKEHQVALQTKPDFLPVQFFIKR
jgi:hypothetical protein